MPVAELKFDVYEKGFLGKASRESTLIGKNTIPGKFTSDDLKKACLWIKGQMERHNRAIVAQKAERLICNQNVAGSIPAGGSKKLQNGEFNKNNPL